MLPLRGATSLGAYYTGRIDVEKMIRGFGAYSFLPGTFILGAGMPCQSQGAVSHRALV